MASPAPSVVPPGFGRNPSSRAARRPLVLLAGAGFLVAGYLALVQLGVLASAWDPVFGPESSARVLHSSFSESLPVSDAALGAAAYLAEVVLGLLGGPVRWRTAPWLAIAFEAVVLASAAAGVGLVVLQATVVHSFCFLCLASTAIGVTVLGFSRLREARAAIAGLARGR